MNWMESTAIERVALDQVKARLAREVWMMPPCGPVQFSDEDNALHTLRWQRRYWQNV